MPTLFEVLGWEDNIGENLYYCNNCKQYLPKSQFYSDSRDKSKVRCHCRKCWNKTNGKRIDYLGIISSLEKFFNFKGSDIEQLNISSARTVQVKYAAKLLELSEDTITTYCRSNVLDAEKRDGRWKINLLSILNYSDKAVENFIREEEQHKIIDIVKDSIYVGEFNINHEKRNCKIAPINETRQCVYFIVQFLNGKIDFNGNNAVIQKVGKADGEFGLRGRLSGYNCDNVNNPNKALEKMYTIFKDELKEETLHLFYMPFDTIETEIPGNFIINVSKAREAEKLFAFYARAQGHPLLFSSFD